MDKHIPNSIGRLDPVTQAIRLGDYEIANKLLEAESARVSLQYEKASEAKMRLEAKVKEIEFFRGRFHVSHEFRLACTEEVN